MAFSATVISPMKYPERISRSLGVYTGKVVLNSYAVSLVTLTAITKYFKPTSNGSTGGFTHGICSVQIDGPSSNGYLVKWDYTTGAFKCYYVDASNTPAITLATSAAMSAGGVALLANASTAAVAITLGHTGTTVNTVNCDARVAAAASELVANVDVGTFGFVAIGFI
jgi:hypothetical protein